MTPGHPTCDACGCTDMRACVTDGVPCSWVQVDYDEGTGICSACVQRFWGLMHVANQVSELLDGQPHSVAAVFPNHRCDRIPHIEIRLVHTCERDEEIEERWPDVDFETVFVDEDDL